MGSTAGLTTRRKVFEAHPPNLDSSGLLYSILLELLRSSGCYHATYFNTNSGCFGMLGRQQKVQSKKCGKNHNLESSRNLGRLFRTRFRAAFDAKRLVLRLPPTPSSLVSAGAHGRGYQERFWGSCLWLCLEQCKLKLKKRTQNGHPQQKRYVSYDFPTKKMGGFFKNRQDPLAD